MISKINTCRPRQNGRHFADDIFKCIFLNDNVKISVKFSLNLVPKGPINNIPSLVHIMAWRRPGDKPLSKWMMVSLLTHICLSLNELNMKHDMYSLILNMIYGCDSCYLGFPIISSQNSLCHWDMIFALIIQINLWCELILDKDGNLYMQLAPDKTPWK